MKQFDNSLLNIVWNFLQHPHQLMALCNELEAKLNQSQTDGVKLMEAVVAELVGAGIDRKYKNRSINPRRRSAHSTTTKPIVHIQFSEQ